ncbi:MAG: hypothetical protein CMB24_01795 [Euryarchaeota archaeon]|nr:hypothetical protein [Euryarchaeota archaeon]
MSYLSRERRYAGDRRSFLEPFYETLGSIPFIPYNEDKGAIRPIPIPRKGRAVNSWVDDKYKELEQFEEYSDPWKKPVEEKKPDPVEPEPDPVTPDPEPEIDPARKAAQDKYRKIFANSIEEGKSQGRSEIDSMDQAVRYSKTMTPEENREYKWAFEETTNAPDWKKWGGGNKMGSGGAKVNAARKAGERSGPGLGFHVGQAVRGIKARFSDTQGSNMKSNPSYRGHM